MVGRLFDPRGKALQLDITEMWKASFSPDKDLLCYELAQEQANVLHSKKSSFDFME